MRKTIFLILILVFISGCSKQKETLKLEVHSNIREEENYIVGINYPTIGYYKFDKKIDAYVNDVYQKFIKEYMGVYLVEGKNELNIDYQYSLINDRFVSVLFTTFINSPHLAHPITTIKTFVFDTKLNKLLLLNDLISGDDLEKLVPTIQTEFINKYKDCVLISKIPGKLTKDFKNYKLFTFTDNALILYFNPYEITAGYCNVVSIQIPLRNLNLKIPIREDVKNEKVFSLMPKSRVIDPAKKVVALTFDDGPSRYTDNIIDILGENNAVATFFVLGNKVEIYQDTLRKSLTMGYELGNHSYNHKAMNRLSIRELKRQVNDTQDVIKKVTGYVPTYFRPTYGNIIALIRKNVNLKIMLWNLDPKDWKGGSAKTIANKVLTTVKDGSVVLMHDTYQRTRDAVSIIVPELKKRGYQFVTVSELEEVKLLRAKMNS